MVYPLSKVFSTCFPTHPYWLSWTSYTWVTIFLWCQVPWRIQPQHPFIHWVPNLAWLCLRHLWQPKDNYPYLQCKHPREKDKCIWSVIRYLCLDPSQFHQEWKCAKHYQLLYMALVQLGLPGNSELKPIEDNELWGKDMISMRKQGDSKYKELWY